MQNKKASAWNTTMLTVLVIFVVLGGSTVIYGFTAGWFDKEEVTQATGYTPPSQAGELASLKYSVETTAQDNPGQFAGTGYCWDITTPSELLESRSGKTLSATAGTTFAPTTRSNTYECTAFSSSHFCDHASAKMVDEGLNLRSKCRNITGTGEIKVTFYEDDSAESTNSLTLGAGATDTYNKFMVEVNHSGKAIPLKAVCFGTNASNSHLKSMDIKNWNKDTVPDSLGSTADDYCFSLTEAVLLEDWGSHIFQDTIVFEADSTGTTTDELITITWFEECEYVTENGVVKKDYFKRETEAEADCGGSNPTDTMTLV